jgi:hypothetical protein
MLHVRDFNIKNSDTQAIDRPVNEAACFKLFGYSVYVRDQRNINRRSEGALRRKGIERTCAPTLHRLDALVAVGHFDTQSLPKPACSSGWVYQCAMFRAQIVHAIVLGKGSVLELETT